MWYILELHVHNKVRRGKNNRSIILYVNGQRAQYMFSADTVAVSIFSPNMTGSAKTLKPLSFSWFYSTLQGTSYSQQKINCADRNPELGTGVDAL